MDKKILQAASEKLKKHKAHMIWVLCLCLLAGLVGTGTYRSLTVSAEALAKDPVCGLEEHTHDTSCYTLGERPLVCGIEESEGHFHNETCFDEEGNLICGQEEHEGHIHGDECYGEAEPVLICERPEHVHTDECYPVEEVQPEETVPGETVTEEQDPSAQPETTPEPEETLKPEETAKPEEKTEGEKAEEKSEALEEIVEKEKEKKPLEFEEKSGNVTVKVSFEDDKAFDEEDMPVTMKVEPIKEGSPEYEAYYNQIIDETKINTAEKMFLFDITFVNKDGDEIEPLKTASVSFTSEDIPMPEKEAMDKEEEQLNVVHIPEKGEAEILDAEIKTAEERHDEEKPDIAFETESFSIYGVVYTVDYFTELDGKTYSWSMEGGTSVSVTDVLINLGTFTEDKAEAFVKDVKDVDFSRPEVLTIENENDVWMIKSLAPFDTEETLTFTLKNGEVFTIYVTDAQSDDITDLNKMLSDVKITQTSTGENVIVGDKLIVKTNSSYDFEFYFKETDEFQFANTSNLYYTLPDGVNLDAGIQGVFSIKIGTRVITGNTYEVITGDDGKKQIKVKFNNDHKNFRFLQNSTDVQFYLNFTGSFSDELTSIAFDSIGHHDYQVEHQDKHNASVKKMGSFNASDNKMHYKVLIHSVDGASKDIRVVDTITGTALNNAQITGVYTSDQNGNSTGTNVAYTDNTFGSGMSKGFDITVSEVPKDQYVTVEYTADVDFSQIANSGKATFTETGNTVKISVPGDEDTTDNEDSHEEPGIIFSSISKVSTSVSDAVDEYGNPWTETSTGNKYRLVTWKVTANTEGLVSLKDSNITDTLLNNDKADYYGDGISVVKITNGTRSEPISVPWADVNVQDKNSNDRWVYPVVDEGNVGYEITYQTRVNITNLPAGSTLEVNNVAKDKYGEDKGKVIVYPEIEPEHEKPTITKYATDVTEEYTTWKLVVTVPKGYDDKLVITDYIPNTAYPHYFDRLVSMTVDGYTEGTDYTFEKITKIAEYWDENNNKHIVPYDYAGVITFNRFKAENNTTLTVHVKTENDPGWIAAVESRPDILNHKNKGAVSNGVTVYGDDESSSQPEHEDIKKTFTEVQDTFKYCIGQDGSGQPILTNETYPIFGFNIVLRGVNSDPVVISEKFNTDLFEIYEGQWNYDNNNSFTDRMGIYYNDNQWNLGSKADHDAEIISRENGEVKIRLSDLPRTKGNAFYPFYTLRLYIVVKQDKLKEFKDYVVEHGAVIGSDSDITSRRYAFENVALWGTNQSKAEFEYTVSDLFKKTGTDNNNGTFSYTIKLNPEKLKMNGGSYIDLYDKFTGGKISASTIQITAEDSSGASVAYKKYESEEAAASDDAFTGVKVIYDEETDTVLTVEIPDETSVVMKYDATSSGNVVINTETGKADVSVTNTATALDYSYTVSFSHSYDFIKKNKTDNTDGTVGFRIDFNENKLKLKGGNTIELTDTFTGDLTIDDDSFTVTCDPDSDGSKAAAVLGSKTLSGNTYTFSVPDNTHVIITYKGIPIANPDESGNINASYSNTAEAENVPVTVTGELHSYILKKTAGNMIVDGGDEDKIGYIPFTIEFNPLRQRLNDGNDLIMTDRFSGLLIDYSTIKTYVNDVETSDLDYDFSGFVGTFTIPDASHIKITYYARPDFSQGAEVDWENTVEVHGFSKEQSGTAEQSSSGQGWGSNGNAVWLYKYESGHMNKPIDNVKFQLFYDDEGTRKPVLNDSGQPVYFTTQNDPEKGHGYVYVALTESNGFEHGTLEQDQIYYLIEIQDESTDGYYPNTTVYNFVLHDDFVKDTQTDEMVPNKPYVKPAYMAGTSVYVFGREDILKVANDRITDEVTAQKYWVNADGGWSWPTGVEKVTFKIQKKLADGTLQDLTGDNKPAYYIDNTDGLVWSDTLDATVNTPKVVWKKLDVLGEGESYSVTELSVNGNPVENGQVTVNGRTYDVAGGTVTNGKTVILNSEIVSVDFEKKWALPGDTITFDKPEGAVVDPTHLIGNKVTADASDLIVLVRLHRYVYIAGDRLNTYDFEDSETKYTVELFGTNWSTTWNDLPAAALDAEGNEIDFVYEAEEIMVTLPESIMNDGFGNRVNIKDIFTAEGEKEGNKLSITNSMPDDNTYYLSVSKEWRDVNGQTISQGEPIEFQLIRYSGQNAEPSESSAQGEVLEPDNNGGYVVDSTGNYKFTLDPDETKWFMNLPYLSGNGTPYIYKVVETSDGGIYWHAETSEGTYDPKPAEGKTKGQNGSIKLVNKYDKPLLMDFEVTKIWKDFAGNKVDWVKDIEIILHKTQNSVEVASYKYKVSEKTVGETKSYEAVSTDENAPAALVSGNATDGYKITFKDLPIKFEYNVTETEMDTHYISYLGREGNILNTVKTGDGGTIVNTEKGGAELPHTGGSGTMIYTIIGTILIAFAGILLLRRKRNEMMN